MQRFVGARWQCEPLVRAGATQVGILPPPGQPNRQSAGLASAMHACLHVHIRVGLTKQLNR
jgi:hypothetical protein